MNINSIQAPSAADIIKKLDTQEVSAGNESFGAYLKNSFNDVNSLLGKADVAASDMAVGKAENLHDAMITFEKADTAFKLLVQVRNRALEAYQEVMRMQV